MSATDVVAPGPPPRITLIDRVRASRRLRTVFGSALPVAWVVVLLLLPYALLLVQSFWTLRNGTIIHQVTLDNYRRLFGTALYPATILYSAWVALRVTAISLLLAFPLAYVLAFKVRRQRY